MPFPDLDSALEYLYRFTDYEKMGRVRYSRSEFDLDRMRRLLGEFGHADRQIPLLVHVAGTKGKGSTCIYTARLLQARGLRVGLYTSPHLEDIRERIQVNGQCISPEALRHHLGRMKQFLDQPGEGLPPTFFDIFTAIAFRHFADEGCDAAVIEVGLGGRLDSTNVIHPNVTVITPIHYDHTDKLGNGLAQIAGEKAGILKAGVPAVFARQPEPAARVLDDVALRLGVPAWRLDREIEASNPDGCTDGFCVTTPRKIHEMVQLSALGRHQRENAALALGAVDILETNPAFPHKPFEENGVLKSIQLPGRIECFQTVPEIILDSSHNDLSAKALRDTLEEIDRAGSLTLLLSIASDKNIDAVVQHLVPVADRTIVTASPSPRATRPALLAEHVSRISDSPVEVVEDSEVALERARHLTEPGGRIVIAGSFYLAGKLRPLIRHAQTHGWQASGDSG